MLHGFRVSLTILLTKRTLGKLKTKSNMCVQLVLNSENCEKKINLINELETGWKR